MNQSGLRVSAFALGSVDPTKPVIDVDTGCGLQSTYQREKRAFNGITLAQNEEFVSTMQVATVEH